MARVVDERLVRDAPKSPEALLALLFDGLDWPMPDHLDITEVPLVDLRPEDLSLREDAIARLRGVQQLPPLTAQQPFGVFILTFEGERLPIGAVRRLVDGLVRKRRVKHTRAGGLWDLDDLIFFCRTGDGGGALHVVAFREHDGKRILRAISWSSDATKNRLKMLSRTTLPALMWPDAQGLDADAWQAAWRDAFRTSYRDPITSAKKLAEVMAEIAREIRSGVREMLDVETEDGPLHRILTQVREHLLGEIDGDGFADMYAQTLVYGLLTARITHPEQFQASATMLTFANPFLDALYSTLRGVEDDGVDLDEFGLLDLVELLAVTDVDQILADFGTDDTRNDPVIYFYEAFLEKYDKKQRRDLGTYYTPIPVVRTMVRLVDEIIRTEMGLAGGVADATTWGDYANQRGLNVPTGVAATDPVIRMLDPATGTGTFLLEWIRRARNSASGGSSADTIADLLERLDAFEVSLSAYTVAHLKVSLELPEEARATERIPIHLTDTLEGAGVNVALFPGDELAAEGQRASRVKSDLSHSVVIGNPPWNRVPSEATGGRRVGGIVRYDGEKPGLMEAFTRPLAALKAGKHAKNLYNLYVYFWRWAIWKTTEQRQGPAVVALITPASFLAGKAFAGMRSFIRRSYDAVWILDLGGEGRGPHREDNVFDGVLTPAAIMIAVRRGMASPDDVWADVRYRRIRGTRLEKLQRLEAATCLDQGWQPVLTEAITDAFLPGPSGEFSDAPLLADLFPWQHAGVQFKRTWTVAPSRNVLLKRWQKITSTQPEERQKLFTEQDPVALDRSVPSVVRPPSLPPLRSLQAGDEPAAIVRYAYRSFDLQWAILDERACARLRPQLYVSQSNEQVFMASKLSLPIGGGPAAIVATTIPDLDIHDGASGAKDIVPLYRDASGTPNVDSKTLRAIAAAHSKVSDTAPDVTVERLFAYTYGVLSGTDYTERFCDHLTTPGPRVPLTADPGLFDELVVHGQALICLDTFGARCSNSAKGSLTPDGELRWSPPPVHGPDALGDIAYDEATGRLTVGDGVLEGVAPDVWKFSVSRLQVLKKWLGYRTLKGTGRAASSISPLDQIRHDAWQPEWSTELIEVATVVRRHIDAMTVGQDLLERVMNGPRIAADQLPEPRPAFRKPPSTATGDDMRFDLAAED